MSLPEGLDLTSIELVLFDLAGTTVDDRLGGKSMVVSAFIDAFREAGHALEEADVLPHRGRDKREAIRRLLEARSVDGDHAAQDRVERLHDSFLSRLNERVALLVEIPGASEVFRFLRRRGIRVGVGSGFPTEVVERLVVQLGWAEEGLLDYVASAEQVGAGRPDPAMIHAAMRACGVRDPRRVLKVGDTVVDVEEGRNAGAWTAAVLTGSHTAETLRAAGADAVLGSVAELLELFPALLT